MCTGCHMIMLSFAVFLPSSSVWAGKHQTMVSLLLMDRTSSWNATSLWLLYDVLLHLVDYLGSFRKRMLTSPSVRKQLYSSYFLVIYTVQVIKHEGWGQGALHSTRCSQVLYCSSETPSVVLRVQYRNNCEIIYCGQQQEKSAAARSKQRKAPAHAHPVPRRQWLVRN